MAGTIVKIDQIQNASENGQFRANASNIGWRGETGRQLVYGTAAVKRAEWYEGNLRVLLEENDGQQILALDGFSPKDYDLLWRFFSEHEVFLKKHKPQAAISEEAFDAAMQKIEESADAVDDAGWGSVQKRAREADLMVKVESIHDSMDRALGGDRAALSRVFAANGCERIGRLRLVIDTVQLEVYVNDPRWKHLSSKSLSIESVLKELGTFRPWKPPEENSSMAKRQMARELKKTLTGEDTSIDSTPLRKTPTRKVEAPVGLDTLLAASASPVHGTTTTSNPLAPVATTLASTPLPARESPSASSRSPSRGRTGEVSDEEVTDIAGRSANPHRSHSDNLNMKPGSIREGWVWKRSRYLKRWRRRWIVLMPEGLHAYKDRQDAKPTESIDRGIRSVTCGDHFVQQANCFCVQTSGRSYYMVCDDGEQNKQWSRDIARTLCA